MMVYNKLDNKFVVYHHLDDMSSPIDVHNMPIYNNK